MAFSEQNAQILRDALSDLDAVTEKKMFGGLCFLWHGHMLCGVHQDGGMARVGKENESAALEIDGVDPLSFTGRPMGGMVEFDDRVLASRSQLDSVLQLARQFVATLPPK